jgi:hypothetical protein
MAIPNSKLSAAAKAVLLAQSQRRCLFEWDHVNDPPCHPSDADWNGCGQCIDRQGLASGLRAAVNQLLPEKRVPDIQYVHQQYTDGWKDALAELLDIAEELEPIND